MTTDLNLLLNSGSIMYHFGVSLVFLSLIIRKVLSEMGVYRAFCYDTTRLLGPV